MSTTIDQRVVEMRFDNQQFERNVSHTMSTLDKLKNLLNFKGASKGLESVNTAAKNVNMNALGHSVEAVSMKFSALQVMGVTALANITNSAVNAGKRIVSALTIDPVMSGFQEYETKMGSIQTILANTEHQGTTMDDVTAALEELNLYADKTIYNFQEMTRNIGTFTAAGVDLQTSVKSIQGIANLAAVSGSTSQQASTAMYQLSQALATGTVKLMDWNSVVNAGMGGKVFQNALIRTAAMLDGAASDVEAWQKKNVDAYGSFRDSLTEGAWLTGEVLTETLKQFTMSAEEGTEEWETFKKSLMEQGYAEAQAEEILKMANTATDAATKVKTFTQLFDTLKESAQSGWAQTWELFFGDFEEAKEFFTGLSDMIGGLINSMSEYRNNLLGGVLDSNWDKLVSQINKAGHKTGEYEEAVRKVWIAHGKTDEQLDDLIEEYGSLEKAVKKGAISSDILKEALAELGLGGSKAGEKIASFVEGLKKIERILGWGSVGDDVKSLQTALEALGHSVGECKIDGIIGPDTTKAIKEFQKEAGLAVDGIAGPETLAALEKAGTSLEDISGSAEDAAVSYDELIDNITKKGGRELFLESFSNVINSIVGTFRALGTAWTEIFPAENAVRSLSNALISLRDFTESLRLFDEVVDENGDTVIKFNENGEKLVRIFKGILAVVDVVTTLIGGGFKIALKIAKELLDRFGVNILDVAANAGDALVEFRDWVDSILNVSGAVDFLVPLVKKAAELITDLVNAVKNSKWFADFCDYISTAADGLSNLFSSISGMSEFQKLVDVLRNAGEAVRNWIDTLKDSENVPGDIIAGLVKGITHGVPDVIAAVFDLAKAIISGICEVLGIASPARTMIAIGGFIIAGLVQGILEGKIQLVDTVGGLAEDIWATAKTAFSYLGERLRGLLAGLWGAITDENGNVQWGKIIAGGMIGGLLWVLIQFAQAFKGFADGIGGFDDLLEEAKISIKKFGKVLDGYSWDLKAKALQKLAISIAILVAAIWVLTTIENPWKLVGAVAVIVILAGVLVGLALAMDKLGGVSVDFDGKKIDGLKTSLLQIALAIGILALVVKMIGDMDPDKAAQGFSGLIKLAGGLVGFMIALGLITKFSGEVRGFGKQMLLLSVAMLLLITVIKKIAGLDPADIFIGVLVMEAFVILMAEMALVNRLAGANNKIGKTMLGMAIAMMLLVGVVKIISGLDPADIFIGVLVMEAFVILMAEMAVVNRLAGQNNKFGGALLSMSISMMLMVGVIKLLAGIDLYDVLKGLAIMQIFVLLIGEMLLISKLGKNTGKVTGTIIAMSVAVGILAGVAALLSYVDIGGLTKGIIAVGLLSLMVSNMARSLKGAQNVSGAMMWMAVAIGVMAAAIVALSFIEPADLAAATIALSVVMGMFALMVKTANKAKMSIGPMAIMVGAVLLLASMLAILASLEIGSTLEIAASIGILMLSLGVTMKLVSKAGALATEAILPMVGLSIIMGMLGLMLAGLSAIKVGPTLEIAASISMLMLTLGVVMRLISGTGALAAEAILPMVGLTIIVGMIGLMLAGLSMLELGSTLEIAASLSLVLLAMSGAALILSRIGPIASAGVIGAASFLGLVVAAGAILGVIGGLVAKIDGAQEFLDSGIPIMESIGKALGALIGGLIGGVGEGITSSLPPMIEDIKTFMNGLSDVANTASTIKAESFDGVSGMVKAMLAISVSSLIEHFASGITGESSMESFKASAVKFVEAIGEISATLTGVTINDVAIETITKCGSMFAELNKSLPRTGGIAQDLAGEQDLSKFATSCVAFAAAMLAINSAVSVEGFEVKSELISKLVTAGQRFNELNTALPRTGGIAQDLAGEQDLAAFGAACVAFANTMIAINESVSAEGFEVHSELIAKLATAGNKFNELNSALPRTGGIAQDLAGSQELAPFGEACKAFAETMIAINEAVNAEGFSVNVDAIDSLKEAGLKLNELQSALPKTGGWWQEIAGQSDLEDFGGKIEAFGTAMSGYSESVASLNFDTISKSINTAYRIKSLITSLVGLDTSGLTAFTGVGSGGPGADGAAYEIAKAMHAYADKVADIDVSAVTTSASVANKLKNLIASLAGLDTSGIKNFKIESVGSAIKTYASKVKGIDSGAVSSSISAANRLKSFISGLANFDSSGVGSFKSAVDELSTVDVGKIVKAFSGASTKLFDAGGKMMEGLIKGIRSKSNRVMTLVNQILTAMAREITSKISLFEKAGVTIVTVLATGISKKKGAAKTAITSCVSTAASAIRSHYSSFNSAGAYLGSGLVLGINSKKPAVYAAGYALGQMAVRGEKDGQRSNSPSKLTIQSGKWFGEGLIIGIDKMGDKVYTAGHNLGDTAVKSLSSTVSRIAAAIDSDMDVQPTIRPVLDLSDIRSGAGAINGMLGVGSSVGVLANVNGISNAMNRRGQNVSNADVVSAIDRLDKHLDNVGNTTYSIAGITYDDGSNIATAVKDLTRYARMERRV